MSNTRKQQPEKISADCPHCGYSQLESAYAKSTICKRCSQHFSIEKLLAKEVGSLKPPSVLERLGKLISREGVREISCFSCGATQQVSTAAESSLCPKCGSYIDLRDFRISGPFGRTVQTQGKVVILPRGEVTTRILCGHGRIEGKMRGIMISSGTIEVRLDGRIPGQVEARTIIVEKKSHVEFAKPLRAQAVQIDGKVEALVICDGRVTVNKSGVLTGIVHARSIVVEKGGIFTGELHIGVPEQAAAAPEVVTEEAPAPYVEEAPTGEAPPYTDQEPPADATGEVAAPEAPAEGVPPPGEEAPPAAPATPGAPGVRRPPGPLRPGLKGRRFASR